MIDARLREEICGGFRIETLSESEARVSAPFLLDGGDQCSVRVVQDDDGWTLSDDGDSIGRAFDYGVDLLASPRMPMILASLAAHRVALNDGALETSAPAGQLSDAVFRMFQAAWEVVRSSAPARIVGAEQNPERRLRSEIERSIRAKVPDVQLEPRWIDPKIAKSAVYPADFRIVAPRPILVFGVSNTASAHRHTITCQYYRFARNADFEQLAVYDERSGFAQSAADHLAAVTDQQFRFPAQRDEFAAFVKSRAA